MLLFPSHTFVVEFASENCSPLPAQFTYTFSDTIRVGRALRSVSHVTTLVRAHLVVREETGKESE